MPEIVEGSIFGWAADQNGCGYYRLGLPFREFKDIGMFAEASMMMPRGAMMKADIIIAQRICMSQPTTFWRHLVREKRNTIFEVDDDLWNIHPTNERAYHFFHKDGNLDRLTENCRKAKLVTVSTETLADVVRKINPSVVVIPNYIDNALVTHERPRNDRLTIGWAGSATHRMDFAEVAPQLSRVLRLNPDVDMHFIGESYEGMVKHESRYTPWSDEVIEFQKSIDFDIGLAPLKRDVFNNSKSYIKVLEYAALGIPSVASDTGPYRDFVKHGETGFLVKSEYEWSKYIRMLINDEAMRKEMGEAGRKQAAKYTIQGNFGKWLEAFELVKSL